MSHCPFSFSSPLASMKKGLRVEDNWRRKQPHIPNKGKNHNNAKETSVLKRLNIEQLINYNTYTVHLFTPQLLHNLFCVLYVVYNRKSQSHHFSRKKIRISSITWLFFFSCSMVSNHAQPNLLFNAFILFSLLPPVPHVQEESKSSITNILYTRRQGGHKSCGVVRDE